MINVDAIFENNFPEKIRQKPLISKPIRAFLRTLFHESEFIQFKKDYPHIQGIDFIEQVLDYFDFSYTVRPRELERIPESGRVVIIANHPIGSLDGLALLKLVREIRPEVKVLANELLMALKPLHSLLLPVDNMSRNTAKKNIRAIEEHLNHEGAIIVFPAGEVSRLGPSGIKDGRWNSGFLRFANKTHSPIVPIFISARNSFLFYSVSLFAKPLSTLLLVREMFLQAKNTANIRIGELIPPESWQQLGKPLNAQTKIFRKHLYRIGKNKSPILKPSDEAIAHPEPRHHLSREISQCESLGKTPDGKHIVLYKAQANSVIMREIGRLREISFRSVGEGCGKRRDVDRYDNDYHHIVLWDSHELEIVGAYRVTKTHENSKDTIYSESLFSFDENFTPYLKQGLELGRSFVQPKYWGKRSLDYLWHGIAAYVKRDPNIRYLFGPVSISASYPSTARDLLIQFYLKYFSAHTRLAAARLPHHVADDNKALFDSLFTSDDYKESYITLKETLAQMGHAVPTLYKQYSELCENGGVQFACFNVDPDFNYCIDGLVVVDISAMKPNKRQRYLGHAD